MMLSRTDIERELGDGICIYPFNENNLKENSINLSVSRYAWTLSSGEVKEKDYQENFKDDEKLNSCKLKKDFRRGDKAIIETKEGFLVVLLPNSTTLIETKEVLAVSGEIGGTYHSKVGIVNNGIGHIGTMLGPHFSGHSLIALHNHSDKCVFLKEGETFVSVVFHYLKTPIESVNPTGNGHIEKLSLYGIEPSQDDLNVLNEDWKKRRISESKESSVQQKLIEDSSYKEWSKREKGILKNIGVFFKSKDKWLAIISWFATIIPFVGIFYIDYVIGKISIEGKIALLGLLVSPTISSSWRYVMKCLSGK